MNILVVNLTRFGDLLQSAAAIRSLAEKDGEKAVGPNKIGPNKIGIVCLENFAAGAALLPEVDAIFPLPSGKILAALNTLSPGPESRNPGDSSPEWLNGVKKLHSWIGDIKKSFCPDAVYNISPTTSSCLLGRLLADEKEYSGFTIDAFGYRHNANPWATFMQGASVSRSVSPFNIVDIFRKVAGDTGCSPDASLLPVAPDAVAAMAEKLNEEKPGETRGFVALQLGASAAIRQWPVRFFSLVGDALWEKHKILPLLLGTRAELSLAEEYAAEATGNYISLIGETDITGLGAALSLSSLLVSNDTGTLHLGAGIGIPVIGMYLATAQPWDTGPYADGNYSLEPDIPCHPCEFGNACEHALMCHKTITPETVIGLAEKILSPGTENFPCSEKFSAYAGTRLWQSTHDEYGFADLTSLSGHENTERTQWMRLQRLVYRQFFDRNTAAPFVFEPVTNPPRLFNTAAGTMAGSPMADSLAGECDAVLALFDAILQQAAMLAENPLPAIKDRFGRTLHRLNSLLASTPAFAAISFMWQNEIMTQQSLDSTIPLMAEYRDLFKSLRNLI